LQFNKKLFNVADFGDRELKKNEYRDFHEEEVYVPHNFENPILKNDI